MNWLPVETAPKDFDTLIDVVVLYVKSGEMVRVPNCRRVYAQRDTVPDTWSEHRFGGRIVNGRTYYDDEGDECFEWGNVPGAQRIVTHWMPIPELPNEQPDS